MPESRITRRTVLRGLGTAMALPWLEAMTSPAPLIADVTARTVVTAPPTRMAFLYGTLLDNCMVVYRSGIADGNRHQHDDLPIAMFGGGGGTIKTGRYIRLRTGTPLSNLYSSMLDRIGAPVERFSDATGKIDELNE